jgi:DNA-binding MarR family transcriptional regulator
MSTTALPCVCTSLRKASRAVTRVYDERLASHGMTTTQFALLRHLARDGELSLSRLADLLVMDRTSLYRTLVPIERQGWIAIVPGRGRAKQAGLTSAGKAAMEAADADWQACQTDIVSAIGQPQWEALVHQLQALVDISRGKIA